MSNTPIIATLAEKEFSAERIPSSHAVHHCGMVEDIRLNSFDKEAVMEQAIATAGEIAKAMISGGSVPAHPRPGVQVIALYLAQKVIEAGAYEVASDLSISLSDLEVHATSKHISSC